MHAFFIIILTYIRKGFHVVNQGPANTLFSELLNIAIAYVNACL